MVASNEFRQDLFYRINVIELHVPALRERGADILLLAEHILGRLDGDVSLSLTMSATDALTGYKFPGNVRELENMLERAVTHVRQWQVVEPDDLHMRETIRCSRRGNRAWPAWRAGGRCAAPGNCRGIGENPLQQDSSCAKLLGLSFRQLRYRIKKLGID